MSTQPETVGDILHGDLTDEVRERARRHAADAPPFTAEQRAKLAELLRPVRGGAA